MFTFTDYLGVVIKLFVLLILGTVFFGRISDLRGSRQFHWFFAGILFVAATVCMLLGYLDHPIIYFGTMVYGYMGLIEYTKAKRNRVR